MTIIFNLETWFNVTAHPLPTNTLLVKHEPDWANGLYKDLHIGLV